MPTEHRITLRSASSEVILHDVEFTFGQSFPQAWERPVAEGFGFQVELCAVLDLLGAVERGALSAGQAGDLLREAAARLGREVGREESAEERKARCRRAGGCQRCEDSRAAFAGVVETAARRWHRWVSPEQYPFAAGNAKGLHEIGCAAVRQRMPAEFAPPAAEDTEGLRVFAHYLDVHDPYGTTVDLSFLDFWVPFQPMTALEARAWMAANTGPQGGRRYRRCKRCSPAP
ncbi:hypothetical protein [Streptomonospora nanhaiensis]|uniref:Uncharacterized protein n=1 Tax=Streptomonospora nanhaiensis TaxID=1323731 RepID=A0A853BVN4_9ACTN|nr:hypothetical protein [Streptomonospora nanhaiensis]MBV2366215.1 hypothetical protein [Streptomonospora nanhaiensis]NYI98272.1 hypothetical protein [Streptomonospora nanhaiensis]